MLASLHELSVFYKRSLKKHGYPFQNSFLHPLPLLPPHTMFKLWRNVQHCRWGGGRGWASVVEFTRDCLFGACEKAPRVQICPKTFVHDCSLSQGYPIIELTDTKMNTWVERGTVRVKCFVQEHNVPGQDSILDHPIQTWTLLAMRPPHLKPQLIRQSVILKQMYYMHICCNSQISRSNPAEASVSPAGWNLAVKISP